MPYKVIKNNDLIGTHERVTVGPAGELQCRVVLGGRVESVYAPGTWDHVSWEEPADD